MARNVPTYLTNVHPAEGRTCLVCGGKVTNGQPAVVRRDEKGAAHTNPADCKR